METILEPVGLMLPMFGVILLFYVAYWMWGTKQKGKKLLPQ